MTGSLSGFIAQLTGELVVRGARDYESKRCALVWNGRPPARFPDLIVRPASLADVALAVGFAHRHGLQVGVRGSGHSYSGIFMPDSGLLLDMSGLDHIAVDASARRICVEAGATSGQVDAALAPHGLAFPVGHGAPVGIAGFLLGGGLGINCAAWGGMSCFNMVGADVVCADGRTLHASEQENPAIFWLLRGSGPGLPFVVTRFHLRCYDRPAHIGLVNYLFRFADLPRLAAAMEDMAPELDPRLQLMLAMPAAPPDLPRALEDGGQARIGALTAIAFADSAAESAALHAPLARHPLMADALLRDDVGAVTFADIFAMTDTTLVAPRVRADNILTDRLGDAVAILMRHLAASPSSATVPLIVCRPAAPPLPDAAFSVAGRYFVSTYAQWHEAGDDDANAEWLRNLYRGLLPIANGSYVNEADLEAPASPIRRYHSDASGQRVAAMRRSSDPENRFRTPIIDARDALLRASPIAP